MWMAPNMNSQAMVNLTWAYAKLSTLYNAGVCSLTKDDTTLLEGIHTRMTNSLCTRTTQTKIYKIQTKMLLTKKMDLLALLHLPTMHGLLRQKWMRWVGQELTTTSQRWR